MSPEQINSTIDRKLADFSNKSQFGVSAVQHHTHNGVDSSKIFYVNIRNTPQIFSGIVNIDGTAALLPPNWGSSKTGTGTYNVTHNLSLTNYSVVICNSTNDPSFNAVSSPTVTAQTPALFTVQMFNLGSSSTVNSPFNFILFVQP